MTTCNQEPLASTPVPEYVAAPAAAILAKVKEAEDLVATAAAGTESTIAAPIKVTSATARLNELVADLAGKVAQENNLVTRGCAPTTAGYVDAGAIPQNDPNSVAGYTFDPFKDPCQLVDIHRPSIPFHNYRQIHIAEIAWVEGMEAPSIKQIPECPPFWSDCTHYWKTVAIAGFLFYEYGFSSKSSAFIRLAEIVGGTGIATYLMNHPGEIMTLISGVI